MEKTKTIILAHQDSHEEFKYYFSVIQIAEESINSKPDVSIDCCKSLIEGVCKSILIRLDNNYQKNNFLVDGVSAIKLFDKAIKLISKYDQSLIGKETDFLLKCRELVETIINIRNDRGDISHGKFTPKPDDIVSTTEFSSFLLNMTDSILSFMLKVFFEIDIPSTSYLDYDSAELITYNYWLDESLEFPIKKAKYSKLLYENDYDEYESRYYDEFLKYKENIEETVEVSEELIINVFNVKETQDSKETTVISDNEKFSSFDDDEETDESPINITSAKQLVNKFDEDTFWTKRKQKSIQRFARKNKLNSEGLEELIENYLFTEKDPLRDEVVAIMNEKPKLQERQEVTRELIGRIIELADLLRIIDAS